MPDGAVIADAVIHGIDIRRPLGRSRPIPRPAFVPLAEFLLNFRWPLSVSVGGNARKRVDGLRLVTSDVDWSYGTGPEVRTSSEVLLLVLTGRPVDAAELSGTGAMELSRTGCDAVAPTQRLSALRVGTAAARSASRFD